ncbi:hypothetical protein C8R45DRAFT_1091427 [Mycena sanguinolenta]|nr:hypothetical protein C8R45DRAFT_1091427 [Mycena sanguinolenta]
MTAPRLPHRCTVYDSGGGTSLWISVSMLLTSSNILSRKDDGASSTHNRRPSRKPHPSHVNRLAFPESLLVTPPSFSSIHVKPDTKKTHTFRPVWRTPLSQAACARPARLRTQEEAPSLPPGNGAFSRLARTQALPSSRLLRAIAIRTHVHRLVFSPSYRSFPSSTLLYATQAVSPSPTSGAVGGIGAGPGYGAYDDWIVLRCLYIPAPHRLVHALPRPPHRPGAFLGPSSHKPLDTSSRRLRTTTSPIFSLDNCTPRAQDARFSDVLAGRLGNSARARMLL